MSFNYLEVAQAAQTIKAQLPLRVTGVELVEFPLATPVPDLNVAFRLADKRMLVFSLKSPWLGVLLTAPGLWRSTKMTWSAAFSGAQDWAVYLSGQSIEQIEVPSRDRVVRLRFSSGAELDLELFPARPNWVLRVGGEEFRWKEAAVARPAGAAFGAGATEPTLREFARGAYEHYRELRQVAVLASLVQRAQAQVQKRLSQLIKIRGQLDLQVVESKKAESYRMQGEEQKAVLHEVPQNQRAKKTKEIEQLFSKYKKLQRTATEVSLRLGVIEGETKKITALVAQLRAFKREDGEPFEKAHARLNAIVPVSEAEPKALKKTEKKWVESGLPRFESKEGLSIWVGRNHSENEELVIRMARGNDLWLHLKGRPGAHVIIQLPGGRSASLETLLDAATLVAYYSDVDKGAKVEVDYTLRKNVKRVPGGGKEKFLVSYNQNKTLMVKIDPDRITRLTSSKKSL